MARYYPAVFEPTGDGYSVWFPDLPGLTSAGDTPEDAMRNAEEGLQGHLALMIEDGDAVPEPSTLDAPLPDWADGSKGIRMLVRAELEDNSRAVRVNITVPEDLLQQIDRYAERHGFTRSGFLVATARERIKRNRAA